MSTAKTLPLWVQDRNEVIKEDSGVEWRYGDRPNYSRNNAISAQERRVHEAGSLDLIAHNLVRTFEMEATFKTDPQQWISVVVDKFRMSTNGGEAHTAQDIINEGTYNIFLKDSEHYRASDENFESSYSLFHTAFPDGFHWELMEVVAGPPAVVFKWRHWGAFKGPYKETQPTGETVEIVGLSIAKVNDDLKLESVEHFFDTNKFLTSLSGGGADISSGGCPVAH